MSVRQLSNGSWIADRSFNGERRTKTVATEREARYWDLKLEFERGSAYMTDEELQRPGPPLREFIEDFFWPSKENLRTSTAASYRRIIRNDILPALGDVPFNKITPADVQAMINSKSSKRAAQLAREVLSSILGLVVDGRIYTVNPAGVHFTYPETNLDDDRQGTILSTYDEHDRLFEHVVRNHADEPIEHQVVLGLGAGLRPEEVYGSDLEFISRDDGGIYVRQVYSNEGGLHLDRVKTESGYRFVPVFEHYLDRMLSWSRNVPATTNLRGEAAHPAVVNAHGGRASHYTGRCNIRKLRAESYANGDPVPGITQWSLRHSYGTASIVDGKLDVNILCKLMGHKDVETTRRLYVRPQVADLKAAVKAADRRKGSGRAS